MSTCLSAFIHNRLIVFGILGVLLCVKSISQWLVYVLLYKRNSRHACTLFFESNEVDVLHAFCYWCKQQNLQSRSAHYMVDSSKNAALQLYFVWSVFSTCIYTVVLSCKVSQLGFKGGSHQ